MLVAMLGKERMLEWDLPTRHLLLVFHNINKEVCKHSSCLSEVNSCTIVWHALSFFVPSKRSLAYRFPKSSKIDIYAICDDEDEHEHRGRLSGQIIPDVEDSSPRRTVRPSLNNASLFQAAVDVKSILHERLILCKALVSAAETQSQNSGTQHQQRITS